MNGDVREPADAPARINRNQNNDNEDEQRDNEDDVSDCDDGAQADFQPHQRQRLPIRRQALPKSRKRGHSSSEDSEQESSSTESSTSSEKESRKKKKSKSKHLQLDILQSEFNRQPDDEKIQMDREGTGSRRVSITLLKLPALSGSHNVESLSEMALACALTAAAGYHTDPISLSCSS
ncbi:hypothetical protein BDR26DRAFT_1004983 [Obelidium mucronatum]|nr:hypothetical protein BDR26DRAFT_1004983 [Obelidium mucronatum]